MRCQRRGIPTRLPVEKSAVRASGDLQMNLGDRQGARVRDAYTDSSN